MLVYCPSDVLSAENSICRLEVKMGTIIDKHEHHIKKKNVHRIKAETFLKTR